MIKKPSFLSRFTSSSMDDTEYSDYDEQTSESDINIHNQGPERHLRVGTADKNLGTEPHGELAVDVYQTDEAIIVKALVAGVQPSSVDIQLTREMITVTGTREEEREVDESDYFHHELYWGSFSRTILLPEEIDIDLAEASEKYGILIITLPKVNRQRQTKLKVRTR